MTRLNQFLDIDDAARDRAALLSSVAGIVVFVLAKALLGLEGSVLGWVTFGTVGSAYLLRVLWYCKVPEGGAVRAGRSLVPRRLALAATAATIFVLVSIAPPSLVEAAMLDRKLRALTRGEKLSPAQAKEIGSLLDTAAAGPTRLPEGTRTQVYRTVKNSVLMYPSSQPFVDAAGGVVRYARAVESSPGQHVSDTARSREAAAAFQRGAAFAATVQSGPMTLPTPSPADAHNAIREFTRTIELATQEPENRSLLSEALVGRAMMYLYLLQLDDVLRDAEAAESKGYTDLSNILELEGLALYWRGHGDDWERAICIFTLVLNLAPPTWVKLSDVRTTTWFQLDALGNLGKLYYKTGKYQEAIRYTETLLERFDKDQGILQPEPQMRLYILKLAYLEIIASNIRLGNINQAISVAHAWTDKTGDPFARLVTADLQSSHFDSGRWLQEYDKPITPTPIVP